jgi:hypothetical protein
MACQGKCNTIFNTLTNLAGVVEQQVEAMRTMDNNLQQVAQERLVTIPFSSNGTPYKRFMDMNPPFFFIEKSDLEVAEHWVREIEQIFKVLRIPEDSKADFETYRLKEDVERWWATILEVKFHNGPALWEQFAEVFYSAYFPKHERSRKMQEFLDL